MTGKELEKRLDAAHITCNKNTVPNDPRSPFVTSGVRLGTPAVTTRGFKRRRHGYDRRVYRTRTSGVKITLKKSKEWLQS